MAVRLLIHERFKEATLEEPQPFRYHGHSSAASLDVDDGVRVGIVGLIRLPLGDPASLLDVAGVGPGPDNHPDGGLRINVPVVKSEGEWGRVIKSGAQRALAQLWAPLLPLRCQHADGIVEQGEHPAGPAGSLQGLGQELHWVVADDPRASEALTERQGHTCRVA